MKSKTFLIVALFVFSAAAWGGRASAQAAKGGALRFLHALPGGPAVDVFVDNVLAARGLNFSSATRYLNVAAGDHTVTVTGTGTGSAPAGTALLTATLSITPDKDHQLIVVGGTAQKPEALVFPQDLGPVAAGNARLSAVHAIKDAPPIDIVRGDGGPLIQGLKYGQNYGEFDLPASGAELAIVPAGGDLSGAIIKATPIGIAAGTHNTLVALGTVEGSVKPSYLLLTAPTASNAATDVLVRFVHAVSGANPVDVYVNGKLTVPALAEGVFSEHLALAAGDALVEFRKAGDAATAAAFSSQTLTLDSTKSNVLTVVLNGDASAPVLVSINDNVATLDANRARINIVNLAGGALTFSLDNKALVSNVANGAAPQSSEISKGVYSFVAVVGDQNVTGNLTVNGGTISDLIVVGTASAPKLILATTGLSEAPGSAPTATAPGAGENTAVAAAPTGTLAPNASTARATTNAPTQPAASTATAPVPTIGVTPRPNVQAGITGTVITNEGVNLKVREYPRTDAKTLSLLPTGTVVRILGVKGPGSKTTTPAPTALKIPTPTLVAALRADIWLFIEAPVPEGGTVTGWGNAEFLDVVNNGRPISRTNIDLLLAFPQIAEDRFGEFNNASVTPIAGDDKRTIGTITTEVGTNVQLRRTPNVKGESLALIPSGGIVFILGKTNVPLTGNVGEPKSATWFNAQYDVEGSSITGWMSADFVKLSTKYNSKPVDVKDVPTVTEIVPGGIRGNATQVALPTAQGIVATVVLLDSGANLQLRRDPTVTAESLGLVPGNSQVDVLGRNGAGSWIQVRFNGNTGWVSSSFVKITRNGRAYAIKDLKIVNGEKDTFGTTTPTGTPVGAG